MTSHFGCREPSRARHPRKDKAIFRVNTSGSFCCTDQQPDGVSPRIRFHLRRTYSGRPSYSNGHPVVCRLSVREHSASPITRISKIEGRTFRRPTQVELARDGCGGADENALRPITLLALAGIGLGSLGEAPNQMVVRRRCILGMGCIMAMFGVSTSAWGLVFKNAVSDVGATVYAIIKYRDPPLQAEPVRKHEERVA